MTTHILYQKASKTFKAAGKGLLDVRTWVKKNAKVGPFSS